MKIPQYETQANPKLIVGTPMQNMKVSAAAFGYLDGQAMKDAGKSMKYGARRITKAAIAQQRSEIALAKRRGKAWASDMSAKLNEEYYDPDTGMYTQNLNRTGQAASGMTKDTKDWFGKRSAELMGQAPNEYGRNALSERLATTRASIMQATGRAEASALKKWEISSAKADMASASRALAARAGSMTDTEIEAAVEQNAQLAGEVARRQGLSERGAVEQYKANAWEDVIKGHISQNRLGRAQAALVNHRDQLDANDQSTLSKRTRSASSRSSGSRSGSGGRTGSKIRRKNDKHHKAQAYILMAQGNFGEAKEHIDLIRSESGHSRLMVKFIKAKVDEDANQMAELGVAAVEAGDITEEQLLINASKIENPVERDALMGAVKSRLAQRTSQNKAALNTSAQEAAKFINDNQNDPVAIYNFYKEQPPEVREKLKPLVNEKTGAYGFPPNSDPTVIMKVRTMIEDDPSMDEADIVEATGGQVSYTGIKDLAKGLKKEAKPKANTQQQLDGMLKQMGGVGSMDDVPDETKKRFATDIIQATEGFTKIVPEEEVRKHAADAWAVPVIQTDPNAVYFTGDTAVQDFGEQYRKAEGNPAEEERVRKKWFKSRPDVDSIRGKKEWKAIEKFTSTPEGRRAAIRLSERAGTTGSDDKKLQDGKKLMYMDAVAPRNGLPRVITPK